MKVYLDVCCLSRPFDDQSQVRIRLESEAVILILDLVGRGQHQWIISEVVEDEVWRNRNDEHRVRLLALLARADEKLTLDTRVLNLAKSLVESGFSAMDALHLAAAEVGGCGILLTTDDALVRKAQVLRPGLRIRVENPVRWLAETPGT